MTDRFLDKVYEARTAEQTREVYDAWAKSYEAEVAENGYVTPSRCATALHATLGDTTTPVLDFGCGTGLSGLALRMAGFATIDGVDLSAGMLEVARRKNAYRSLDVIGPDDPVPGGYGAIAAIGVIGAGAAPLALLERIFDAMPAGAQSVFSFNSHTLEDPAYEALVDTRIASGDMRELWREHGPHLPARDITATVYVLEKA